MTVHNHALVGGFIPRNIQFHSHASRPYSFSTTTQCPSHMQKKKLRNGAWERGWAVGAWERGWAVGAWEQGLTHHKSPVQNCLHQPHSPVGLESGFVGSPGASPSAPPSPPPPPPLFFFFFFFFSSPLPPPPHRHRPQAVVELLQALAGLRWITRLVIYHTCCGSLFSFISKI